MKPKWLNRELVVGPHLILVTSEKEFKQVLKQLNFKKPIRWIGETATATTTTLECKSKRYCLVSLNLITIAELDPIDIATVLVHEAVHVFQQHCKNIGEDNPSEEFEAYSIQHISQQLMIAYRNTLKK